LRAHSAIPQRLDGDIFCAGQAALADGRLLVAGGTYAYPPPPIAKFIPPFAGLEVKGFKPEEIASEKLIAHTLRISTDYLVGYVEGLAREDPTAARALAEKLEVPLVRTMTKGEGKTKELVEIVSVAEYFRR